MTVTTQQIDDAISQHKEVLAFADSLKRLSENKDFQTIIEQGYFINEASKVVLAKANPAMLDENRQKGLNNSIIAIGELKQYFIGINLAAENSEKSINDLQEMQAELDMGVE